MQLNKRMQSGTPLAVLVFSQYQTLITSILATENGQEQALAPNPDE
jgi:hypothetical protein